MPSIFTSSAPAAAAADTEIIGLPLDSISSLSFSGKADYLALGSWENSVRVYEVNAQGQSQAKAMYIHQGPVLSVCWNDEGNRIFSGGADGAGRMFDVVTGQTIQVAQHDAPVKVAKWVQTPQAGVLATGSWDKTIKYWDLRTPTPIFTVSLPERCYSLDVTTGGTNSFVAAATAERHIQVFDLKNPTTVYKSFVSPLRKQTRVVRWCSPNPDLKRSAGEAFAVGSVEGRVAIHYVEDKYRDNNYSFRCHRRDSVPGKKDQSVVYAVNDISFHPVHGTFSTCGSDGVVNFWDGDARMRLKSFDPVAGPVACSTFNASGTIFAYAVSYDWHKGLQGMTNDVPNKVMLHTLTGREEEVRRRARR